MVEKLFRSLFWEINDNGIDVLRYLKLVYKRELWKRVRFIAIHSSASADLPRSARGDRTMKISSLLDHSSPATWYPCNSVRKKEERLVVFIFPVVYEGVNSRQSSPSVIGWRFLLATGCFLNEAANDVWRRKYWSTIWVYSHHPLVLIFSCFIVNFIFEVVAVEVFCEISRLHLFLFE